MSRSTHQFRLFSRVLLATLFACSALFFANTQRASAMRAIMHVTLVKSEPKMNDTLAASPKAVRLWFSEAIQTGATSVRLTGADGKTLSTGKVTVAPTPKSPAEATIAETLKPGRYTIDWRTMASDGHPAKGALTFVVR
jgi:methionine-rich copper-binding protein CopC